MAAQFRFKSVPYTLLAVLVLSPALLFAQQEKDKPEATPAKTEKDDKVISGMSILGNQDAPKSLVIVPWKGSELGESASISTMLDDSRLPIDKEVFMRMLSYYEIRSETAHPSAAPAKETAAQPAAAQRRK